VAPGVRIDLRSIPTDLPRLLESGEADLAIGLIPPLGAGFCQQKLFASRFLCALRVDHPRVKNELTLERYQAESHLSVTTVGTGYHSLEKALEAHKIHRHVAMRVPSFLGVAAIVADTDYLVIVPQRLGRMLAENRLMKLLPLPFDLPGFYVTQNWHERYTQDPPQQWFRNILMRIFREDAESPRGPAVVPKSGKLRSRSR
jgi:DNA-binding transcriptional LysR family regulator